MKLKTLIPMEELEQEAQQQIYNALKLDFLKTFPTYEGLITLSRSATAPIGK